MSADKQDTGCWAFAGINAYTLGDAARRRQVGGVIEGLRPQTDCKRFVGRALTARVEYRPHSSLPLGEYGASSLLDKVGTDDVVLLDGGGRMLSALGDLAMLLIQQRGGVAAVINACVRDIEDIDPAFPVFARGVAIASIAAHGFITGVGEPVHIEGITIECGDIIAGCSGGIVTVPATSAEEVRTQALELIETDRQIRQGLKNGQSMDQLWSRHKAPLDKN